MRLLTRLSPHGRKIFDWILGLTLVAIGLVGLVLPILQGWVFILGGLVVLSRHNRLAEYMLEKLKGMGRKMRDRIRRVRRRGQRASAASAAENGTGE